MKARIIDCFYRFRWTLLSGRAEVAMPAPPRVKACTLLRISQGFPVIETVLTWVKPLNCCLIKDLMFFL